MRIAIISDVHSNLEALQEALKMIETLSVDEIVCLGDIVGYGANPNECAELVFKKCSTVLLGNHDLASVDLSVADFFTAHARTSAHWTSKVLHSKHKVALKRLPYTSVRRGLFLAHASPFEPEEWHYVISIVDARQVFSSFSERICFVGHSHVPGIFGETTLKHTVDRSDRFVVNVGSIGQPRDGNPKLSFGVFDTEQWEYRNVRVEYDVETASDKILQAGLPRVLAERILRGM